MFLILLGPPGSGKGTQAKTLSTRLKLVHLSTGDLLRAALKENRPLGIEAKAYMDKGELVPDELILGLIGEKMLDSSSSGYLLDGFPRTVIQAESLDAMLDRNQRKVDLAIKLNLLEETLIKRLSGRVYCPKCNANFNVFFDPPKGAGKCDNCQGTLERRPDDQENVVRNRIKVYRNQTEPVEDYYGKQGLLHEVNADQPPDKVTEAIVRVLISSGKK